jgi:hypothetical protein
MVEQSNISQGEVSEVPKAIKRKPHRGKLRWGFVSEGLAFNHQVMV